MKPFLNDRRVWVLLMWVLTVSSARGDLPATREEFLRIDRVWDLELNLTPEAWDATAPELARPRGPQFARTHSQGSPRNVVRDRGSTTPRWRTGFWSGIDRCKPNSMAIGQRPHPGCV
jgi:hypothetical protein